MIQKQSSQLSNEIFNPSQSTFDFDLTPEYEAELNLIIINH